MHMPLLKSFSQRTVLRLLLYTIPLLLYIKLTLLVIIMEIALVCGITNSLLHLATIEALFSELAEDNEVMRERTLKMLALKLRSIETGSMKPEVKELLIKECKKILQVFLFTIQLFLLICNKLMIFWCRM